MRFLIVIVDYPDYLHWLYASQPGLERLGYGDQVRTRVDSLHGSADFYSANLRALGHEAWVVWANNEAMQMAWAREHGVRVRTPSAGALGAAAVRRAGHAARRGPLRHLRRFLRPVLHPLSGKRWLYDILAAQIQAFRPDVLLNQAVDTLSGVFFREMKPHTGLVVGQVAARLRAGVELRSYDFMLSSLPNLVEEFRGMGVPTALNRLAFEPRVLESVERAAQDIPVSFIGSISPEHGERVRLVEHLCERTEISIWGNGVERLPVGSSIRSRYAGPAWGRDMYRLLGASKITVNNHGSWAASYANNMRLFEATGMGTLLLTDWKANLHQMFEPDREVVTYRDHEECAERIRHYLNRPEDRLSIARAGQRRTLRDHTYRQRMEELVEALQGHVISSLR
jgi:hypothetical protein